MKQNNKSLDKSRNLKPFTYNLYSKFKGKLIRFSPNALGALCELSKASESAQKSL